MFYVICSIQKFTQCKEMHKKNIYIYWKNNFKIRRRNAEKMIKIKEDGRNAYKKDK